MIFEKVTPGMVVELTKLRMNLNHFYLLELFQYEKATEADDPTSRQFLERKGLVLDNVITDSGKSLYEQLTRKQIEGPFEVVKLKSIKSVTTSKFDEWWDIFPSTNLWFDPETKVRFTGSRSMKLKKQACKEQFTKFIISGKYTEDQIIQGTKNDIDNKKAETIRIYKQSKKIDNKMSYMSASEKYLRTEEFASWIEVEKEEKKEIKSEHIDI